MEPIELMEICEDDEASDTAKGDTDLEQSFLGGATVQKRLEMFFLSFFTLIRDLSQGINTELRPPIDDDVEAADEFSIAASSVSRARFDFVDVGETAALKSSVI